MGTGSETVRVAAFFPAAGFFGASVLGVTVDCLGAAGFRFAGFGTAGLLAASDTTVFAADGAFGFRSAIRQPYPRGAGERTYVPSRRSVVVSVSG
ncbi:MAG: hypothetical protein ABIP21_13180 [Acidimicrobiia bacterium]